MAEMERELVKQDMFFDLRSSAQNQRTLDIEAFSSKLRDFLLRSHPDLQTTIRERREAINLILKCKELKLTSPETVRKMFTLQKDQVSLERDEELRKFEQYERRVQGTPYPEFFDTLAGAAPELIERKLESYLESLNLPISIQQEIDMAELAKEFAVLKMKTKKLITEEYDRRLRMIEKEMARKLEDANPYFDQIYASKLKDFILQELS